MKFKLLRTQGEKSLFSIEQVTGRIKSINSILEKCRINMFLRINWEEKIGDIAGVRIICQFCEDIEKVASLIRNRSDMRVLEEKDYVTHGKDSGYRSYHIIVSYCAETLAGKKEIRAEIQIRTLAMDFWATIEHSLQYKYKCAGPCQLANSVIDKKCFISLIW